MISNLLPDSSITSSLMTDDFRPMFISVAVSPVAFCCLTARFGPSSS